MGLDLQPTEKPDEVSMLSKETEDIVNYIGGCVIQKMRKKISHLLDSKDKGERLLCLQQFIQADENMDDGQSATLTSILNRGRGGVL